MLPSASVSVLSPTLEGLRVNEAAAQALGRIGAAAVEPLTVALRDPDSEVRLQATIALARIGPDAAPAVPLLVQALRDDSTEVRIGAARALGQIGPGASAAVPNLIEALRDYSVAGIAEPIAATP